MLIQISVIRNIGQGLLKKLTACAFIAVFSIDIHAAQFSDITSSSGLSGSGRGASWVDFDNDGCVDVMVVGLSANLFKGACDGSFTNVTEASGIGGDGFWASAWADFDADGDMDFYLTGGNGGAGGLFENNGDGSFSNVNQARGIADEGYIAGASWADIDNDGDLDLFLAGRFAENTPDLLYRNDGTSFTEISESAGLNEPDRLTFMGAFFDYDADGDLDLYLAVDFGDDVLMNNNGQGIFTNVSLSAGVSAPQHGMGVAIGDIDNNGCLDVLSSNNGRSDEGDEDTANHGPSALYLNNCDGTFQLSSTQQGILDRGVVEWGLNMIDYDNDGDLDVSVVAGGMLNPDGEANVFYENDGTGHLHDITQAAGLIAGGQSFGSAWADVDNDGDLDWMTVSEDAETGIRLFRNDSTVGNFIKVRLRDTSSDNIDGIGAVVSVTAGSRTQMRLIRAGVSYVSGEELEAHVGLGIKDVVDRVAVQWPNGSTTELLNVGVNQTITLSPDVATVGSIGGTVLDPEGNPVAGVRVLMRINDTSTLFATTLSDTSGGFFFDELLPNSYQLFASQQGGPNLPSRQQIVELGAGEAENITLQLRAPLN